MHNHQHCLPLAVLVGAHAGYCLDAWAHLVKTAQMPAVRLLLASRCDGMVGDGNLAVVNLWNERHVNGVMVKRCQMPVIISVTLALAESVTACSGYGSPVYSTGPFTVGPCAWSPTPRGV